MNELGAREDPYSGKAIEESDAGSQHQEPQQQPTEKI